MRVTDAPKTIKVDEKLGGQPGKRQATRAVRAEVTLDIDFKVIRDGLERLRTAPADLDVFGAGKHGFRPNPPLGEEEIRSFEVAHRISLPADYRRFLAEVGDGGAGPAYGLFKLGEMDDGFGHKPWREGDHFVGILSEPFRHTGPWNDLDEEPEWDESAPAESERRWEEFTRRYWRASNVNGAIPICHLGCAYRLWLVVNGPEAGHVWCDDRADLGGLYPLQQGDEERVSFIRWYQGWLDDALCRLREEGSGCG